MGLLLILSGVVTFVFVVIAIIAGVRHWQLATHKILALIAICLGIIHLVVALLTFL